MTIKAIEATDPNENTFAEFLAARKFSFSYEFVPFSKSRNAVEAKFKTLNWKVTFKRDGRDLFSFDYSAGEAHCPAYKRTFRCVGDKKLVIAWECENGKVASSPSSSSWIRGSKDILPKDSDVMDGLIRDSDVINYSSFEEWAGEFGYGADSPEAEKIYKTCMRIALGLKNAFTPVDFATLQAMFVDN